jgi:hypothetical protein
MPEAPLSCRFETLATQCIAGSAVALRDDPGGVTMGQLPGVKFPQGEPEECPAADRRYLMAPILNDGDSNSV